jgi:hypothetical protein
VTLAALARHEDWGTIALPLQAQLYIREADLPELPPERPRAFRTKLEMAVGQLNWIKPWVGNDFEQLWVVVDGDYAKKPFLQGASRAGYAVISRLRRDAALCSLPLPKPANRRGPQATYGKRRISLAKRAGQTRGWQQVDCVQYGERVTKTVKTFLATYRPAGGVIRVVIVKEEDGWLPFFGIGPEVTAAEILEAMADRNAEEQVFKDEKGGLGGGPAAGAQRPQQRGVLQPEPVDVQPGGGVGVRRGGGGVGGPQRQPLGPRAATPFARRQA